MSVINRILVSNDDGVHAEGIRILANALAQIAAVDVVAPDRDRSGASNSLTLINPLRVVKHEEGIFSVNGTPTDCVHIAVTGMLHHKPDIVVSGINNGANLGDDVLYSGTVAAATEGRFLGLPSIAISLAGKPAQYYATAAAVAKQLVTHLMSNSLASDIILNVNVPDVPYADLKGFQVTRFGTRKASSPSVRTHDARGRVIYWVGEAGDVEDASIGTDFFAIRNNYVSITPLKIDLTDYHAMEKLTAWVSEFQL